MLRVLHMVEQRTPLGSTTVAGACFMLRVLDLDQERTPLGSTTVAGACVMLRVLYLDQHRTPLGSTTYSIWTNILHLNQQLLQELVSCYVYSTWINNGAIQCAEGGSHNRPNKHAELAKEMVR